MFGKISEKARRQAYLNALAQEKNEGETKKQATPNVASEKKVEVVNEPREIVSGKEAVILADKELKISSAQSKGIIKNRIADMKYYKNWRARVGEVERASLETKPVSSQGLKNPASKPDYSEIGVERSLDGDDATIVNRGTESKSTKGLLDELYPNDTKQEDEDDFSFLDDFFNINKQKPKTDPRNTASADNKKVEEKKPEQKSFINRNLITRRTQNQQKQEDYSISDFENESNEDYAEIAQSATKVNVSKDADLVKKPKQRKKKKKFDADIIGTTGFFTIR